MNKFFLISVAAFTLASCSSDEETSIVDTLSGKLVDANIGISIGDTGTTRAYLGKVTRDKDEDGTPLDSYTIVHQFEAYDKMYITDYLGQHEFKVQKDGQTTTISGKWAEIDNDATKNGICAYFPKEAVRQKVTVTDNKPTMYFTLPTVQTPYVADDFDISYDQNAGLAFACANNKSDNLWFIPVVSYLYFYSKESTCTITSTENIAGNYTVTYEGQYGTGTNADGINYGTAEGLKQFLKYTATSKTITCNGRRIDGHKNVLVGGKEFNDYEYIIAVKPGHYAAKSLWITPNGASKSSKCPEIELIPSYLYYLGSVDDPATSTE